MPFKDMLLCLGFSLALPAGQMLFKWGADYSRGIEGNFIAKVIFNYPLMGAFAWYGLTALFWFYILTRVPLSLAYPFSILGAALGADPGLDPVSRDHHPSGLAGLRDHAGRLPADCAKRCLRLAIASPGNLAWPSRRDSSGHGAAVAQGRRSAAPEPSTPHHCPATV